MALQTRAWKPNQAPDGRKFGVCNAPSPIRGRFAGRKQGRGEKDWDQRVTSLLVTRRQEQGEKRGESKKEIQSVGGRDFPQALREGEEISFRRGNAGR